MKLSNKKERLIQLIIQKPINNSKIILEEMVNVDRLMADHLVTMTHTSQLDQMILNNTKEERSEIFRRVKEYVQRIQSVKHSISIYLTQEPIITAGYGQQKAMDQMVLTKHIAISKKIRTLKMMRMMMMTLMQKEKHGSKSLMERENQSQLRA